MTTKVKSILNKIGYRIIKYSILKKPTFRNTAIVLRSKYKIRVHQLTEFGLSLFMCAEMSYYGYLYAKIKDREHYQMATGYVKAGTLSGICLSGLFGQLIVYLYDHDYSFLPYYSLPGTTVNSRMVHVPRSHH